MPIVNISSFIDDGPSSLSSQERLKTSAEVNRACVEHGFFYLIGHGIPSSKLDEVLLLARQFFSLPLSEKKNIKRYPAGGPEGGDGARGYQEMRENVTSGKRDCQEAVDLYREWDHESVSGPYEILQGPNLWPTSTPELKSSYLDYIDRIQKVGKALMLAMGIALDLPESEEDDQDENVFVRNTESSFWGLRMIGYPKLSAPLAVGEDPAELSCGEHTDYGCVTLLLTDATPGALQILAKDGSWINADPMGGAFIVNIGDMMERWTNGLWKSTRHRVIHKGDGYRVSVPFFYDPNFKAVVKPLKRCVEMTGGVPTHEGDASYGEYLRGRVLNNFTM